MAALTILILCFWAVGADCFSSSFEVILEADRPSLRVPVSSDASLDCCFKTKEVLNVTWVVILLNKQHKVVPITDNRITERKTNISGVVCHKLILTEVRITDAGFYQCFLSHSSKKDSVFTHGTYLQVYRQMVRTLDISESTKNSILTAEGVFLMMLVLVPGCLMLCKSKKLNLQKHRKIQEENIYEGLNLEECCSAYDQVQRSLVQGPYQDVGNLMMEVEEEIQLENP